MRSTRSAASAHADASDVTRAPRHAIAASLGFSADKISAAVVAAARHTNVFTTPTVEMTYGQPDPRREVRRALDPDRAKVRGGRAAHVGTWSRCEHRSVQRRERCRPEI